MKYEESDKPVTLEEFRAGLTFTWSAANNTARAEGIAWAKRHRGQRIRIPLFFTEELAKSWFKGAIDFANGRVR